MKQILVTGAGGYIGTVLVPMLLSRGFAVRALDRFFFGRDLLARHPHLELVREDTRRLTPEHLGGVFGVIDLAAVSNDPSGDLFQEATWAINGRARARTARLAKAAGVERYVLPSSCSVYGFRADGAPVDETAPTGPLTTYARANEQAERSVLPLADEGFCVTVLRQATVYGLSPRMRFDLAINGMTYGAWKTGKLPLMRDGTQWRPMVHVRDAASAMMFMLKAEPQAVNGRIFNVGSDVGNYRLARLAEVVAAAVPRDVAIEWYGDPDTRSYRVSFAGIEALGWRARLTAEDGVGEICRALADGAVSKTKKTLTLDWYKEICAAPERHADLVMYGGMLDIEEAPQKS